MATPKRGDARPVEPGTFRAIPIAWSELDELLITLAEAWDLIEALHMAAEAPGLTPDATAAIQTVASVAQKRVHKARKAIARVMEARS